MFNGTYLHTVDAKGRINIPARLRKNLAPEANDSFMMTRGTAACIDLYPLNAWAKVEEDLNNLNLYNPQQARFVRLTLQYAVDDKMDSQSRILIPQVLLDYAKIEKDVLILGVLRKIEIWNPKIFEEYKDAGEDTYEQIAEKVMAG
jgi:MraZ protein